MGKIILFLLGLLLVLVVWFADDAGYIDLDKMTKSEEPYTPPSQYGYMWRWNYGQGESDVERFLNRVTHVTFFEIKPTGEVTPTGNATCVGMRCW